MFKLKDTTIYLTRGDYMAVTLNLVCEDGTEYIPEEGDVIWFRVKESPNAKACVIEKQVDTETMYLILEEEDTMNLKFKRYLYEMELVTADDKHYTFIELGYFIVGKELECHD